MRRIRTPRRVKGAKAQDAGGQIVKTVWNAMSKFADHHGYATMLRKGETTPELLLLIKAHSGANPDSDSIT